MPICRHAARVPVGSSCWPRTKKTAAWRHSDVSICLISGNTAATMRRQTGGGRHYIDASIAALVGSVFLTLMLRNMLRSVSVQTKFVIVASSVATRRLPAHRAAPACVSRSTTELLRRPSRSARAPLPMSCRDTPSGLLIRNPSNSIAWCLTSDSLIRLTRSPCLRPPAASPQTLA